MDDEVIDMQLTCTRCGRTVKNDLPRSKMPDQFEFLAFLRSAGWQAEHHYAGDPRSGATSEKRLCPKCVSSS